MKKAMLVALGCLVLAFCKAGTGGSGAAGGAAAISATRWTEKTELFLEYPPLVAGEVSRFSVHLTELGGFKPLTEGRVVVELRSSDGSKETFSTDAPSRPGIFGLDVKPAKPGAGALFISLESPTIQDSHEVGAVKIFADPEEAARSAEGPEVEAISFLKEQQWTLDFATAVVSERPLRESLRVPAEVRPRTGGEAEVIAPVAGRIAAGGFIPGAGTAVERGQVLSRIIPKSTVPADRATLELGVTEATSSLMLAGKDRQRVERLVKAGALPERRLLESTAEETNAKARLEAARALLSQYEMMRSADGESTGQVEFMLRAPISGVLAESWAVAGSGVEEGQMLFRVIALDPVHIIGFVPESESERLASLTGGELALPGDDGSLPVGRIVSVGRVVDPGSRTVSVIFEMANPRARLAVGQSVFIRLFTGGQSLGLAVPESAIVDDAGRPVVFVQTAGESFLRRPVRLGIRDSGQIGILEGVKRGERVVTAGAYQIRLAALSPQVPAHGHVH
jgi:membrane fusion protein, heavy metal efflux system